MTSSSPRGQTQSKDVKKQGLPTILSLQIIDVTQHTMPLSGAAVVDANCNVIECLNAIVQASADKAYAVQDTKVLGAVSLAALMPHIQSQLERSHDEHRLMSEKVKRNNALVDAVMDELRTSLGVVQGSTNLLEKNLINNPESIELTQRIKRSITKTLDILAAYQGIIMHQDASQTVKVEDTEVTAFIAQLVAMLQQNARIRGVQISMTPAAPINVKINRRLFGQTLRMLLENVVRIAAPGQKVQLDMAMEMLGSPTDPRHEVAIRIYTGDQPPPKDKTSESDDLNYFGEHFEAGVTHALLKELLSAHSGSFIAKGGQKSGAYFEVRLPAVGARTDLQQQLFGPVKIMIVEDDFDILHMLEEVVTNKGFQVMTAMDGQEALDLFNLERPTLVLADIRMPRLNGIELSKAIKNIDPAIPVILFSGQYPNLMEDRLANKIIADHVLYKPFASSDILESLSLFVPDPVKV